MPLKPASWNVGMSGSVDERVSDDCARKRKVLFSKCGISDVGPRHAIGTCAAIRSFTAWPAPLIGHVLQLDARLP